MKKKKKSTAMRHGLNGNIGRRESCKIKIISSFRTSDRQTNIPTLFLFCLCLCLPFSFLSLSCALARLLYMRECAKKELILGKSLPFSTGTIGSKEPILRNNKNQKNRVFSHLSRLLTSHDFKQGLSYFIYCFIAKQGLPDSSHHHHESRVTTLFYNTLLNCPLFFYTPWFIICLLSFFSENVEMQRPLDPTLSSLMSLCFHSACIYIGIGANQFLPAMWKTLERLKISIDWLLFITDRRDILTSHSIKKNETNC